MPAATFQRHDQLGEIVLDNPPLNLFSETLIADLRTAADEASGTDVWASCSGQTEGARVIRSQDLQDGSQSLQRAGPGHATFANR